MSAVTVEEAQHMWCPAVRKPFGTEDGLTASNSRVEGWGAGATRIDFSPCMASSCMWWRWKSSEGENPDLYTGYCGMAGRPE